MKIIITGGTGQLGTELVRQIRGGQSALGTVPEAYKGAEVLCPGRDVLDIANGQAAEKYIRDIGPDIVFHCAAMTNVDGCEDVPEQAEYVNGKTVGHIARACEAVGAKLVFISTDYVFDGEKRAPYRENDPCSPQTAYGRGKLLGERNALECCSRTFVVRTSWLYGQRGKNFVKTILRKAREGGPLRVVDDQFGNPTNAEDLAFHLLKLAATDKYGVFHCTGKGICNWYEFANEIVRAAGINCPVLPCSSAEYLQRAKRPAYSALAHDALAAAVGDGMRPWKEALKDYIQRVEEA